LDWRQRCAGNQANVFDKFVHGIDPVHLQRLAVSRRHDHGTRLTVPHQRHAVRHARRDLRVTSGAWANAPRKKKRHNQLQNNGNARTINLLQHGLATPFAPARGIRFRPLSPLILSK